MTGTSSNRATIAAHRCLCRRTQHPPRQYNRSFRVGANVGGHRCLQVRARHGTFLSATIRSPNVLVMQPQAGRSAKVPLRPPWQGRRACIDAPPARPSILDCVVHYQTKPGRLTPHGQFD